jgi:ribonuclease BN (tRNA processing enzyme)
MKVIFLGTNGWYTTRTGNTLCTLIQTDHWDILLDAGNGLHRADRHIDGQKPVYLFISHYHVDHIEGLHTLAKHPFHMGLTLCGPAGSRSILNTFLNAPFTLALDDLTYPTRILQLPEEAASIPFPMETLPLRHTSLTLGCRMEIDGRTIAYCPDTGYCENAVTLGRAADLLITECAFKAGQANENWPHLNPEMAARIADEAGAKRLVLTHFDASLYRTLAERNQAAEVAGGIFAATTAARDGLRIVL